MQNFDHQMNKEHVAHIQIEGANLLSIKLRQNVFVAEGIDGASKVEERA